MVWIGLGGRSRAVLIGGRGVYSISVYIFQVAPLSRSPFFGWPFLYFLASMNMRKAEWDGNVRRG